jgi:uncharacterized protein (TIGR00730 family)
VSDGPVIPGPVSGASPRDAAIREFAARFLECPNRDLLEEMMVTLCRLARDQATRGDLKLLHKALAELRYAFKVFAPYRTTRKITIFGSARTPEDHPNYLAAVEFARAMCAEGWMVITGAGDGIMKAGHGGAGRQASFGVAIRLPFEQRTNDIIADDSKLVSFRYFFTRKLMFMKEAAAVALFPGGFGTQDECFEVLTLIQTGKATLIPILMCEQPDGNYWPRWHRYISEELLGAGLISHEDEALFRIVDRVQDAVDEVRQFYRVYHSMRYVGSDLILRLRRPVSQETLERIHDEAAADILVEGRIEVVDPHPAEGGEHPELVRLRMRFNRRNFGRLRWVVDAINRDESPE